MHAALTMLAQQQQQQSFGSIFQSLSDTSHNLTLSSLLAKALSGPQKLLETLELMPTCLTTATGDIVSSNNRFATLLQIPTQFQTHTRLSLQMNVVSSCYTALHQALQLVTLQGCATREMTFMINTPEWLTFAGYLVLTTTRTNDIHLAGAAVAAFIVPKLVSTSAQSPSGITSCHARASEPNNQRCTCRLSSGSLPPAPMQSTACAHRSRLLPCPSSCSQLLHKLPTGQLFRVYQLAKRELTPLLLLPATACCQLRQLLTVALVRSLKASFLMLAINSVISSNTNSSNSRCQWAFYHRLAEALPKQCSDQPFNTC